jgi:hypothetical protein
MARKKSSHKKPSSKATRSATKRKPAAASTPTSAHAMPKAAAQIGPSVYEDMAQRTLGLWREQLSAVSRSPTAMHEMGKMMQPVFSLFTQGMDMWLMMADPFSRGASAFNGFTSPNDAQTAPSKSAKIAAKKSGKSRAKRKAEQPAPVTASIIPGVTAMAELARRIANMERQQASAGSRPRAAGGKTASVIGFEEALGQRQGQRRKA